LWTAGCIAGFSAQENCSLWSSIDERHRLTFYGTAQLPYGFSVAPIYTFGSGVPADIFLPSTAVTVRAYLLLLAKPGSTFGKVHLLILIVLCELVIV
jgi:hypothetical protein